MKKVVILLPTFNEKANLENFVREVLKQEKNTKGWDFQILITDSNSTDGTLEIAKRLSRENKKIHLLVVGRGLGTALIEGHKYSMNKLKADALAQMDADGQVDSEVLPKLLKALDDGYDLALGSRFVKGGQNQLSYVRKLFTWGSCTFSRIMLGPSDIGEFTTMSRAFTVDLFKRIDLDLVPWREKTYIIMPAFLNEAVKKGAKYKEVPIIFKDREEGYSKNKVFNYTYDVITYGLDARLKRFGINIPFFHYTRKAKTLVKFGLVGLTGTMVDFFFYKVFIASFGFPPASAKAISSEIAIINNFTLNNFWTFKYRKTNTSLWRKLLMFNLVSLGGLAISVLIVKFLDLVYGDGFAEIGGLRLAYNNFYFFATIPPVMIWNFTVNHLVTWREKK